MLYKNFPFCGFLMDNLVPESSFNSKDENGETACHMCDKSLKGQFVKKKLTFREKS